MPATSVIGNCFGALLNSGQTSGIHVLKTELVCLAHISELSICWQEIDGWYH
jgi:hypothetical protein